MFAGVATVLFCGVVVVPFIYGLYLTFTSWDGVSLSKPFVGFANYAAAFADTSFWSALGRTVIYSVISVVLINVVAFFLAFMVTRGIRGQNLFRAGFFIPNLIGGIVLGYVWQFVFNRAFPAIFKGTTSLLGSSSGAMAALIIVSVWHYAGYRRVRREPLPHQRRAVRFLRTGGHARVQSGLHLQELRNGPGAGIHPVCSLRDHRCDPGVHR